MAKGRERHSGPSGGSAQNIDLNTASLEELSRLSMVGKTRAQNIINYREEHGPFKSWEDLDQIPGFSKGMVEDIKKSGVTLGKK
ncbi:MAG: helix-hairpin-helix domain-containing protein [bacterium]